MAALDESGDVAMIFLARGVACCALALLEVAELASLLSCAMGARRGDDGRGAPFDWPMFGASAAEMFADSADTKDLSLSDIVEPDLAGLL